MKDLGFLFVEPVFGYFGDDFLREFLHFHHVVLMFRFEYFLMSDSCGIGRRFSTFRKGLAGVALFDCFTGAGLSQGER